MELFKASRQWSSRPADERFEDIKSLHAATAHYASTAVERSEVRVDSLRAENINAEVYLGAKGELPMRLTNWSFGQLSSRVGAPPSYLRDLPATLAVQNLNYGLSHRLKGDADATTSLLVHANGELLLRAMTSDKYSRIWNWEVAERLLDLESQGWAPATPFDLKVEEVEVGQKPLYASDHDMFAFIVHPDRVIREAGNPSGLRRGLIVSNSEVGAGALKITKFLYRVMCSNHIIWGAEDVLDLSAVHVGKVREKFATWKLELTKYFDASSTDEEARIVEAQTKIIAPDKDAVLDAVFGRRIGLTYKVLDAAYDMVQEGDGDPRTTWGLAQGLTRYSQQTPYADERVRVDRAAGKVLSSF